MPDVEVECPRGTQRIDPEDRTWSIEGPSCSDTGPDMSVRRSTDADESPRRVLVSRATASSGRSPILLRNEREQAIPSDRLADGLERRAFGRNSTCRGGIRFFKSGEFDHRVRPASPSVPAEAGNAALEGLPPTLTQSGKRRVVPGDGGLDQAERTMGIR